MNKVSSIDHMIAAADCSQALKDAAKAEVAELRAQVAAMQAVVEAARSVNTTHALLPSYAALEKLALALVALDKEIE